MHNDITAAFDLGHGWAASKHDDGRMTIQNCEIGLRVTLPPESVKTLRDAFASADELSARHNA